VLLSTALVSATTVDDGFSSQEMQNLGMGNRAGKSNRFLKPSKSSKKKKSEEPSAVPSSMPSRTPSAAPSSYPAEVQKIRARAVQTNNDERLWSIVQINFYYDDCTQYTLDGSSAFDSGIEPNAGPGSDQTFSPNNAFDGVDYTIWGGGPDIFGGPDELGLTWIGRDFDSPTEIQCVSIFEYEEHNRIATEVIIEAWYDDASGWKPWKGMSPQTKPETQLEATYQPPFGVTTIPVDNIFSDRRAI